MSAFATNSTVLVAYFAFFVPGAGQGFGRALTLIVVPLILAIINIGGVSGGAKFGGIFAVAKIAALVLFAGLGLAYSHWSTISGLATPANANWGIAILGLIYT